MQKNNGNKNSGSFGEQHSNESESAQNREKAQDNPGANPSKANRSFGQQEFSAQIHEKTEAAKKHAQSAHEYEHHNKVELEPQAPVFDRKYELVRLVVLLAVLIPLFIWSFWGGIADMVHKWHTVLDYSHGYLVIPLACCFFWLRMDTYPGTCKRLQWLGLIPMFLAILARCIGSWFHMDALDQLPLILWIWGCVWFFYGNRTFLWALPVLIFLVFMFPIPDRINGIMRNYLQPFAAQFAAFLLQLIGEPAIAYERTIRHGNSELEVEAACSGLRFIISISAIALATVLLFRRSWLQNIIVLLAVLPIALFVNASRIAMTGLFIRYAPEFLERNAGPNVKPGVFADTLSGYIMIFATLLIFALFLWYLGRVFRRVSYDDIANTENKSQTKSKTVNV